MAGRTCGRRRPPGESGPVVHGRAWLGLFLVGLVFSQRCLAQPPEPASSAGQVHSQATSSTEESAEFDGGPALEWDSGWTDALPQDADLRVERLQAWLKSDDPEVLSLALLELRKLSPRGRATIPRAVELLGDGRNCLTVDPDSGPQGNRIFDVRWFAKEFLRAQLEEAVPALTGLLVPEADEWTRKVSIEILGTLGEAAQEAAPGMAALCRRDSDQVSLLIALNDIDVRGQEVVAVALDMLDHEEESVRYWAVRCLGWRRQYSGFVGERLLAATYDPAYSVRSSAALALGELQIDPERSVRRLCQLLADENGANDFWNEMTVANSAMSALQQFPAYRNMMVPDLVRSLRKTYSPEAIDMLREVGPGLRSQIDLLREFIMDSQWELQSRVELSHLLHHFGVCPADADFLRELADLLEEPHDRWRIVAAAGLVALSAQPPPQAFVILDKALDSESDDLWMMDQIDEETAEDGQDGFEVAEMDGEPEEDEDADNLDTADTGDDEESDPRFEGERLFAEWRVTLAVQLVARLQIRDEVLLETMHDRLRKNESGIGSPFEILELAPFLEPHAEELFRASCHDQGFDWLFNHGEEVLRKALRLFPGYVFESIQRGMHRGAPYGALNLLRLSGRLGRELIPDLLAFLESSAVEDLEMELDTLVALGPHDEQLPNAVRQAMQSPKPNVRQLACRCLAQTSARKDADVVTIRELLTDESIIVRVAACRALVAIAPDDPQTAAALKSLLADPSGYVRHTAERLLSQ